MDDMISLTSKGTSGVFVARPARARGAMLIASYLMLSLVMVYYSAMTIRTATQRVSQETLHNRLVATELAHGAMAQLREDLFQFLSTEVHAHRYQGDAVKTMEWLDKLNPKNPQLLDIEFTPPQDLVRGITGTGLKAEPRVVTLPTGTGRAWINSINAQQSGAPLSPRDIVVRGQATVGSITRQTQAGSELQAGVRIGLGVSDIFQYAYFVNNYGWFDAGPGSQLNIYGEVRANGDLEFSGPAKVDGDLYAASNPELINPRTGAPAAGVIAGSPMYDQDWLTYYNSKPLQARPARLVVAKGQPAIKGAQTTFLPAGQGWDSEDPAQKRYPAQSVKAIPYLGDLGIYKDMATSYRGTGSTLTYYPAGGPGAQPLGEPLGPLSGVELIPGEEEGSGPPPQATPGAHTITAIYYGPDGIPGNADDAKPLVLDGTQQPIEIDGPIVVPGDVIIKGRVTGRGTIYAGRNVHIVGAVTYNRPSFWWLIERHTDIKTIDIKNQQSALGSVCDDGTYLPPGVWACPDAAEDGGLSSAGNEGSSTGNEEVTEMPKHGVGAGPLGISPPPASGGEEDVIEMPKHGVGAGPLTTSESQ